MSTNAKFKTSVLSAIAALAIIFGSVATATDSGSHNQGTLAESAGDPLLSTGKYIAGGMVGTFVGFGIGHGIQGRWASKGWIFTAGEIATLVWFINSISQYHPCDDDDREYGDCNSDKETQANLAMLGIYGFRIWEIVDVWSGPHREGLRNRNHSTKVGLAAVNFGGLSTNKKLNVLPALSFETKF